MKVGFLGALTLIFITLKLTGFIGWSWLWVVAPIWLPVTVLFVMAASYAVMAVAIEDADGKKKARKLR
jgi:hypothetical protein